MLYYFYKSCIIVLNIFSLTLQATTKEGYLLKQTWSFQRWKRRYFRLKGHKLFYAKFPEVSFVPLLHLIFEVNKPTIIWSWLVFMVLNLLLFNKSILGLYYIYLCELS